MNLSMRFHLAKSRNMSSNPPEPVVEDSPERLNPCHLPTISLKGKEKGFIHLSEFFCHHGKIIVQD
jgi:hypothetical protein